MEGRGDLDTIDSHQFMEHHAYAQVGAEAPDMMDEFDSRFAALNANNAAAVAVATGDQLDAV